MNRYTKKDFEVFKKTVYKYQDLLGLKDWRIDIHFQDFGRYGFDKNCGARLDNVSLEDRICAIRLNGGNMQGLYPMRVIEHAKHEVLELLLWELGYMGTSDFGFRNSVVDGAIHRVIRRLEKIL